LGLAGEFGEVGEGAEVAELVGIHDGTYGLDHAVGDVERYQVDDPPAGVGVEGSGLAVHLGELGGPRPTGRGRGSLAAAGPRVHGWRRAL
jgi:hypothetical protein